MFRSQKKYDDFIKPSEELRENAKGSIKSLIDGSILTRNTVVQQIPFVVFLVALAIFYINNRYRSEKIYHEMVTLEKELKEFRFEAITTASNLMHMSKQSEVIKRVKQANLPLEELDTAPVKIYLKKI